MQTHETVLSFRKVESGSDRKFGLAFGGFFALVALWPLVHHAAPRWWALPLSVVCFGVALFVPAWLAPLNRAWFKFGLLLNKIVSPLIMTALFFGAVVPLAWFLRRKGEDLLSLNFAPESETYWIMREPPGPAPGTMRNQF